MHNQLPRPAHGKLQEQERTPPLDPKSVELADDLSARWPDDLAAPKPTDTAAGNLGSTGEDRAMQDAGNWPDDLAAPKSLNTDDAESDASMKVDLTAWPDDLTATKPVLKRLDSQEGSMDNFQAWEAVEKYVKRTSMPPNWDEDVALDPPGGDLVRLPQYAHAKVANANASTMPLMEPRPGCDLQMWFISMPGDPPEGGVLRQRWLARARYLRVAIASAATQQARLMPVVVFVGACRVAAACCCIFPTTGTRRNRAPPAYVQQLRRWLQAKQVTSVDWHLRFGGRMMAALHNDVFQLYYHYQAHTMLPIDLPMVMSEVLTVHLPHVPPELDTSRYLYTDAAVMFRCAGVRVCG